MISVFQNHLWRLTHEEKGPDEAFPSCCKHLKCDWVLVLPSPNTRLWHNMTTSFLNLLSIRNHMDWLQSLHFQHKTSIKTPDIFPIFIIIAITQSFCRVDKCQLAGHAFKHVQLDLLPQIVSPKEKDWLQLYQLSGNPKVSQPASQEVTWMQCQCVFLLRKGPLEVPNNCEYHFITGTLWKPEINRWLQRSLQTETILGSLGELPRGIYNS